MPHRIRTHGYNHRNPGSQCCCYGTVIRLMAERNHHIRLNLLYKRPQTLSADSELGESASALFFFIQAHMDPGNALIYLKLIFSIPLRSNINLIAFLGKLVGKIRDYPFRSALLQAVYVKYNFTHPYVLFVIHAVSPHLPFGMAELFPQIQLSLPH